MKNKHQDPIDSIYGVPVFLIESHRKNKTYPNTLVVSFRCPCGKTHEHGWGKDDDPFTPQHRVEHCHGGQFDKTGYYIVMRQLPATS
jgi:hypothetical protein